jgi:hypothetical protein
MAVVESSPLVGSSSSRMAGLISSSWPMHTRLRSPPAAQGSLDGGERSLEGKGRAPLQGCMRRHAQDLCGAAQRPSQARPGLHAQPAACILLLNHLRHELQQAQPLFTTRMVQDAAAAGALQAQPAPAASPT